MSFFPMINTRAATNQSNDSDCHSPRPAPQTQRSSRQQSDKLAGSSSTKSPKTSRPSRGRVVRVFSGNVTGSPRAPVPMPSDTSPKRHSKTVRQSQLNPFVAKFVAESENVDSAYEKDWSEARAQTPDALKLTRSAYLRLWVDFAKVQEAEDYAASLPKKTRVDYALQSLQRIHSDRLKQMLKRGVFSRDVARTTARVALQLAIDHMLSNDDDDSCELSAIRVLNAAADTVLWKRAQEAAENIVTEHRHRMLPKSATLVDVLERRLDAYRRRHIPVPPRPMIDMPEEQLLSAKRRASLRFNMMLAGVRGSLITAQSGEIPALADSQRGIGGDSLRKKATLLSTIPMDATRRFKELVAQKLNKRQQEYLSVPLKQCESGTPSSLGLPKPASRGSTATMSSDSQAGKLEGFKAFM